MSSALEILLLALEGFVVAFLFLHDWIPLGRLNNIAAMRGEDSLFHRAWVTLLPGLPAAIGFVFSVRHFETRYPSRLEWLLWITYGLLLLGLLRAWWIPYLLIPDPERAARYENIFQGTHRFLPRRHGIAPDTLALLHFAIIAVTVLLFLRDRWLPHP